MAAAASPLSNATVEYPGWYLQRWHLLPEGYLSRRSVQSYDALIRQLYNVCLERAVIAALVSRLRERAPASLLEVGCGPGHALAAVAEALPGAEVTGLDLSPFMLEFARKRASGRPNATLVHGDALRLPWSNARFEAVTAVHVFGHMPREAAAAAVAEARRVLAPGGRLYVVDHVWHRLTGGKRATSFRLLGGLQRLYVFES